MSWDWGGAYANTAGTLQEQEFQRLAFPLEQQARTANVELLRQQVAEYPTKVEQSRAAARLNNANAATAEEKLAADRRLTTELGKVPFADNEDEPTRLMKLAGAATKAGDPATARAFILQASQARANAALVESRQATARKAATDARVKQAERYAELMNGVRNSRDPASAFKLANRIFSQEFGEPAPAMEYNPQQVDLLYNSAITMRDRAYAEHLEETRRLRERAIGNTAGYRNRVLELREAEEEGRERRAAARNKDSGKDVGAPTSTEIKQAEQLLLDQKKPGGKVAAGDLAARARALRKRNPGLDAGEAQTRALVEMEAEGFFTTEKAKGLKGLFGGEKSTYGRPGATAARPLPAPADRSFKKGVYYQTPKGPLQFLGDGKWQVPPTVDAVDEDDEDEE